MAEDRHSKAEDAQLLTDPDEIARREAENGLRQFSLAIEIIALEVVIEAMLSQQLINAVKQASGEASN